MTGPVCVAVFPRFTELTLEIMVEASRKYEALGRQLNQDEVAEILLNSLPMKTEATQ